MINTVKKIYTDSKRTITDKIRANLLLICVNLLFLLLVPATISAQNPDSFSMSGQHPKKKPGIKVTAEVPSYWWLELTGWTSPHAHVELSMTRELTRITTADSIGKFTFNVALPRSLAPFCLIATDISGNSSYPLCISQPNPESNILVKEIVLPPTISLEKGDLDSGETVAAQGYTTPNSVVVPYLFDETHGTHETNKISLKGGHMGPPLQNYIDSSTSPDTGLYPASGCTVWCVPSLGMTVGSAEIRSESAKILLNGIKGLLKDFRGTFIASPVYGAELPKPEIKSDQTGFYQFNLPSNISGKNRVFVGSKWQGNPSPKSNTLVFNVYSWWERLLLWLLGIFQLLFSALITFLISIPGIIFVELISIIVIFFHRKSRKTNKALMVIKDLHGLRADLHR